MCYTRLEKETGVQLHQASRLPNISLACHPHNILTIYSQYPTHDIHLKLVGSSDGGIDNSKAALPQLASKLVQLADNKDSYDFHLKTL